MNKETHAISSTVALACMLIVVTCCEVVSGLEITEFCPRPSAETLIKDLDKFY